MKILGILAITVIFTTILLSWKQQQTVLSPSLPETTKADTTLRLSPSPLLLSSDTGKLDVIMDTGKNTITFVQLKLSYNSRQISDVNVLQGAFMSKATVLNTFVDQEKGTLTYIISFPKNENGIQGKGIIATISFKTSVKQNENTSFHFSPETQVTDATYPGSLLEKTSDAKLTR